MVIINRESKIAKIIENDGTIYKIGLNETDLLKTDKELDEIAIQKYEAIKFQESNPLPLSYKVLRAKEYPPIPEQLDMIYWDKVNGTNNWVKTITAVKEKYPKL